MKSEIKIALIAASIPAGAYALARVTNDPLVGIIVVVCALTFVVTLAILRDDQ